MPVKPKYNVHSIQTRCNNSEEFSTKRIETKLPKIKQRIPKIENPDVAKFLHGDFKLQKLPPLPDLNKYKNDPFLKNPLLKFKLSAGKSRRVYQFLEHQAVKNKRKTYKESLKVSFILVYFIKVSVDSDLKSYLKKIFVCVK